MFELNYYILALYLAFDFEC